MQFAQIQNIYYILLNGNYAATIFRHSVIVSAVAAGAVLPK